MKKTLTLDIHDLSSEGDGVARRGKDVYFVPGALPGETVTAVMGERKRRIWHCELKSIDTESADRISPECPHFSRCGGCNLQHMTHDAQVIAKQQRVEREFQRQGISADQWDEPIVGASFHYRRRARLGIRYNKNQNRIFIGFREKQSSHLTDIDVCPVLTEHPALDWSWWREHLLLLECRSRLTQIEVLHANETLVLVFRLIRQQELSPGDRQKLKEWASEYGIDICIRPDEGNLIYVNEIPTALSHTVGRHQLRISPDYFVQVNEQVNRKMVEQAVSWLSPESGSRVWDLFAGHGNFSFPLADIAVTDAVEVSTVMVEAIESQKTYARHEVMAHCVDLSAEDGLSLLPDPEYVLLDPPRAGAAECMPQLAKKKPKRILYVSCDPATLVRDVKLLHTASDGAYVITRAAILDMFPHTHHVETMVLLEKVQTGNMKVKNKTGVLRG